MAFVTITTLDHRASLRDIPKAKPNLSSPVKRRKQHSYLCGHVAVPNFMAILSSTSTAASASPKKRFPMPLEPESARACLQLAKWFLVFLHVRSWLEEAQNLTNRSKKRVAALPTPPPNRGLG